jgi:hypothetical protein
MSTGGITALVQVRSFPDLGTLMEAFPGIDLLHLFANIDVNGQLRTATREGLKASVLLDVCVSPNVKVVNYSQRKRFLGLCEWRSGETSEPRDDN